MMVVSQSWKILCTTGKKCKNIEYSSTPPSWKMGNRPREILHNRSNRKATYTRHSLLANTETHARIYTYVTTTATTEDTHSLIMVLLKSNTDWLLSINPIPPMSAARLYTCSQPSATATQFISVRKSVWAKTLQNSCIVVGNSEDGMRNRREQHGRRMIKYPHHIYEIHVTLASTHNSFVRCWGSLRNSLEKQF